MKKFKSLMLAALASAALAAPSFADGHGNGIAAVTGQFEAALTYSSVSVDGDDTVTKQDTSPGVNKINFAGDFYDFLWEEDGGSVVKLKVRHTITSGDNTVSGAADFGGTSLSAPAIGDYNITGGNKSFSLKVGKFGTSDNYANGMGVSRASVGQDVTSVFSGYEENLDIPGFRGLQADINAGDVKVEVAMPWMNVASGTADLALANAPGGTNVTGIRPKVSLTAGSISVTALAYSLTFGAADAADDPDSKTSNGAQLMGSIAAGSATIGAGYTTQTRKDGDADAVTPNVLNGYVTVALGGGSSVGAYFDISNDGAKEDATVATRVGASYTMPFFVESVSLKLGIGSATQTSDNGVAGSASSAKAGWVYAF